MGLLSRFFDRRPSPHRFARLMMRRIRAGGYSGAMEYDAKSFLLRFGDKSDFLSLGNAYAAYCELPRRQRPEVLRRYASLRGASAESEPTLDEAKSNLLPRLQSAMYHDVIRRTFEQMERRSGKKRDLPITRPFAGDLMLDLVYDRPDSIQAVNQGGLREWGIDFEEGLKFARENLWRRSNEAWETVCPGLHLSPWRDTHDVARLFLHDLIWQLPVKGAHVALAPNRVTLLVTGADDEAGLVAAAALADKALETDRIVSGMCLRLAGSAWEPWLPPPDHAAYWPLKKFYLRVRATDYDEQKKMIDASNDESVTAQFIPQFFIRERQDGSWFTAASWGEGVEDALLPLTDWVYLSRYISEAEGVKLLGYVRFDSLRQVVGELLKPTDYFPPRFHITQFPTPEQLKMLDLRPEPE